MPEDICKYYNQKIDNIIEFYRYKFLGSNKRSISYLANSFYNKITNDTQLKELELTIYSVLKKMENDYLDELNRYQNEYKHSTDKIKNILGILLNTENMKNIIYVSDELLLSLLENKNSLNSYSGLHIMVENKNIAKFRAILEYNNLYEKKFDSLDIIDTDYGLEFYLGNVRVKVSIIDLKYQYVIIKTFNKENLERSLNQKIFVEVNNDDLLIKGKDFNYINPSYYNLFLSKNDEYRYKIVEEEFKKAFGNNSTNISRQIDDVNNSFFEIAYNNKKVELLSDLESQKNNDTTTEHKQFGYISVYFSIIVISLLLVIYTFLTIINY